MALPLRLQAASSVRCKLGHPAALLFPLKEHRCRDHKRWFTPEIPSFNALSLRALLNLQKVTAVPAQRLLVFGGCRPAVPFWI